MECCHEVLEHGAGNLAHRAIGRNPVGIGRQLNVLIHRGWIGARLHQHRASDPEYRERDVGEGGGDVHGVRDELCLCDVEAGGEE